MYNICAIFHENQSTSSKIEKGMNRQHGDLISKLALRKGSRNIVGISG
jgi:hypothetical protein